MTWCSPSWPTRRRAASGARGYLADSHRDLFEGVTEAIGEVGGFSATLGGQRLYLLQTAEKGMAWLRLSLRGPAGHGSMKASRNVVAELAETVARIGRHEWPLRLTPAAQAFLEAAAEALGHRARERMRGRCWRSWARWPG